jgi:hypothetical protein
VPEHQRGQILRKLFAPPGRQRAFIALGALASVAVAAGIILGAGLSGTSAGANQPAKSAGAATVQRRDLVQTDTEPGTLSYANPHTVFNRLSGTVTSLPAVGQTITRGQTLYQVSGAPVVLMTGSVPAYRDLSQGVSNGPDVQELEQNLVALGFDPSRQITVDQTFDAATAAAVDRWQAALGESQTGTVSLGQVVFLPGAQRVTAIDTVLGSTGGSSSGSGSSGGSGTSSGTGSGASLTLTAPHPEFVSLTTTTTSTTTSTSTTTPAAGTPPGRPPTGPTSGSGKSAAGTAAASLAALVALLRAEIAELKKGASSSAGASGASGKSGAAGASSGSGSGAAGGSAGKVSGSAGSSGGGASAGSSASGSAASAASPSAQAILQTTSTKLVVTVDLDATKQSEAVVGGPVTVQMPDGTTVDGTITAVSPVAVSSTSSSSSSSGAGGSSTPSATVPITITLRNSRHVSGLDQAAVSVNFQQQKARNVLSVPVSALLATAGGGYDVQEAAAPQRLIPVTAGLFAAGYVQISGPQITPGLQVTDSQG